MRHRALVLIITSFSLLLAWAPSADAASADADAEAESARLVNDERRARGLPALAWDDRIAGIARDHSWDMARDGELRHSSNLPGRVGDYEALGENVGYGPSTSAVHNGFMNSDSHRAAILREIYTHIGVGVVRDGDLVWVTQVFYTPRESEPTGDGDDDRRRSRRRARSTTAVTSSPPAASTIVASSGGTVRQVRATPTRRARAQRAPLPQPTTRTLDMLGAIVEIDDDVVVVASAARATPRFA